MESLPGGNRQEPSCLANITRKRSTRSSTARTSRTWARSKIPSATAYGDADVHSQRKRNDPRDRRRARCWQGDQPAVLRGADRGRRRDEHGLRLDEQYPLDHGKPTAKYGTLGLFRSHQIPEIRRSSSTSRLNLANGAIGIDAAYTEDGETFVPLSGDTQVSMNFWGFTPEILDEIWTAFPAFLAENLPVNPEKCEFYLPTFVGSRLAEKKDQCARAAVYGDVARCDVQRRPRQREIGHWGTQAGGHIPREALGIISARKTPAQSKHTPRGRFLVGCMVVACVRSVCEMNRWHPPKRNFLH